MRKTELKETKILNAIFSAYSSDKSATRKIATTQPYIMKFIHTIKRTFYVN